MKCDYETYDDVLSDLIRLKDQFWCYHCERGLFFPSTCAVRVEVENEEDVDDDATSDFLYWEILPHNNPHVGEIMPYKDLNAVLPHRA
jgi:hypothetical protein